MKRLVFATLFVCLSLQFACTKGPESKTEAAREPLRISDSDLEQKITDQFKADPQLRDTNLSVDADADRCLPGKRAALPVATCGRERRAQRTARVACHEVLGFT